MASGFAAHAAEMHASAASRSPNSMMDVKQDLYAIEGALSDVTGALRALTTKAMEEYPLHPGVSGAVGSVHALQLKAQEAAADIRTAMQVLHEQDLKRHEQPRQGEAMWDVSRT